VAGRSVADHEVRVDPGISEVLGRLLGESGVKLDGGDMRLADEVGEKGARPPGARADLQHPMTRGGGELFQQVGNARDGGA
jgi:hypothetical protein